MENAYAVLEDKQIYISKSHSTNLYCFLVSNKNQINQYIFSASTLANIKFSIKSTSLAFANAEGASKLGLDVGRGAVGGSEGGV